MVVLCTNETRDFRTKQNLLEESLRKERKSETWTFSGMDVNLFFKGKDEFGAPLVTDVSV